MTLRQPILLPISVLLGCNAVALAQLPHATPGGFDLANGWRITPAGEAVGMEDMVLKLVKAPDDRL